MTHSFLYGTAVFEGIRAYWNEEQGQLYLLKLREHFERIVDSSKILLMDPGLTVEEMMDLTIELVRRNGYREDAYVRATVYKSDEAIGVKLHGVDCRLNILSLPFGDYIATDRPITCGTVSWRRTARHQHPVTGEGGGLLREPGLLQDRGDAQRLRGGHRPDQRGQGLRGLRREPLHGPEGSPRHARRALGHPRGHHARRRSSSWPARSSASTPTCAPSTGASSTSPTRSSSAGPAPRCRRSRRSTIGRSGTAASGRSPGGSCPPTSTRSGVGRRAYGDWLTPVY